MEKSFKPGKKPSISEELQAQLNASDDDQAIEIADELDRYIQTNGLQIRHFGFARDLDLAFFILNDKRIITITLSDFPFLKEADDYDLDQYRVSELGIHWYNLDIDMSLRGLLKEEKILTK